MENVEKLEKEKLEKEKLLEITRKSYYVVFYFMLFALLITFFSSMIVNDSQLRRILILETMVTGISSFMYYLFINNISTYFDSPRTDKEIDLSAVNRLRYNGWIFTTPIMLIVLCLVLQSSTNIPINPILLFTILLLDYLMLLLGYLGEVNEFDRLSAMILGFIPFFLIFYLIFITFIIHTFNPFNYLIFGIYFFIWAGYGISYIFEDKIKNISMNIFDCISKAIVAILLSFSYIFW